MSYREKLLVLYMKYHGMPMPIYFSCWLFLKLDALNDRREAHLVKPVKSFISGKCQPATPSLVEACIDKTLLVSQSNMLSASNDHL